MEIRDSCGVVTVPLRTSNGFCSGARKLVSLQEDFHAELKMVDQHCSCHLLPVNKAHTIAQRSQQTWAKAQNIASMVWLECPLCPEPCLAKQLSL